jgi:hydroxymethylpyrimidine/phosphomethylpyrimidine kinase
LKAFSAHGVFGMTVVTSVVAENSFRVVSYQDIHPKIIEEQMDAVFEDIPPHAVKIGMLSTPVIMRAVVGKLREWKASNIVLDPVMYAKHGAALMEESAIDTLITEVVPLADVITPNIPEAEKMTGITIQTDADVERAAQAIHRMGCPYVIIKGGHLDGDATDRLFDGKQVYTYPAPRVDSKHTHGTGCTFSSAIAANLAQGLAVPDAVALAKTYIHTAILHAPGFGRGNGPTHHFYEMYKAFFKE